MSEATWAHGPTGELEANLGYTIAPAHTRQGYATEVAHTLLRLAFDRAEVRRVTAEVSGPHLPSHRVLEKVGMRVEARQKANVCCSPGEWIDDVHYALLREEWERRNG